MPDTETAQSAPAVSDDPAVESRILTAQEMEALERANIERALASCCGKISGDDGAARLLGLAPSTLSSRMKSLGIQKKG
jgi:transcriptional regulator with GAF, ATPase, and Fis domain